VWPENGILYRNAKRVERWLLKESDGFVVLTEKAREILFPESCRTGFDKQNRAVEVIPCCVDLSRFQMADGDTRQKVRRQIGAQDRYITVYAGSLGGWYLTKETADFYGELKQADKSSFALILTQSNPQVIEPLLKERGLTTDDYFITKVPPSEISTYFSAADAALSFCRPSYSKQAASPTKNAEYLASGLPIIANRNVGDIDTLIDDNRVGVFVSDFSPSSYLVAAKEIGKLGDISKRCREVAEREFDLEKVGGERYRRIYRKLMDS
jgi:glycosyltransferase involved in cell wall biosynthesis